MAISLFCAAYTLCELRAECRVCILNKKTFNTLYLEHEDIYGWILPCQTFKHGDAHTVYFFVIQPWPFTITAVIRYYPNQSTITASSQFKHSDKCKFDPHPFSVMVGLCVYSPFAPQLFWWSYLPAHDNHQQKTEKTVTGQDTSQYGGKGSIHKMHCR